MMFSHPSIVGRHLDLASCMSISTVTSLNFCFTKFCEFFSFPVDFFSQTFVADFLSSARYMHTLPAWQPSANSNQTKLSIDKWI